MKFLALALVSFTILVAGCATPDPAPGGGEGALTVFGLGVELIERMPDTDGVPFDILSTFAMSNDMFHCVIATNDHSFVMPTFSMGNATVPKNALFMVMDATSVTSLVRLNATHVEMKGQMRSITRVGADVFEDSIVSFTAEFSDKGGKDGKDTVVLKPLYDEAGSPMQRAIFGPEPHFGHGVISGDISITGA